MSIVLRRLHLFLASCLLCGAISRGAPAAEPPSLTTCAAVRGLSPLDAARGLPVILRGVITVVSAPASGGFTLDDGAGLWVARPRGETASHRPPNLRAGDWVEVSGHTQAGHFLPTVAAAEIKRLGRQPLPIPRAIGQLELTSGALDGQRVQVRGVVQAAERQARGERDELRLVVSSQGTRFSYTLFDPPAVPPESLIDAEVELSGVFLAYFNARRQFLGVRIHSNQSAEFAVTRTAPHDAFAVPEVALSEGMLFSAQGGSPHRRRVRGIVTLCVPGQYFFLQENDHALRVNTRQGDSLQPGDLVEASGFFSLEHHKAEMLDAIFRRLDRARPPAPVPIASEQLFTARPGSAAFLARDFDDYLVSLRGQLVSVDPIGAAGVRLNLESNGVLIPAELTVGDAARALSALRIGSDLSVSGVCVMTFSGSAPVVEWPQPVSVRLLLRNPADVIVVRAASWWTRERLWSALGIFGAVSIGALAWVALLRRTVAVRSRQLADAMRERRDAAVEFESTLRERSRLAADLHDTLEQSLTGLALQLEASEALRAREADRSQQHMTLAKQVLDRSREDLRRSIWNLHTNPLEAANLTEALREIAANRSAGLGLRIVVQTQGATRPLPDFVAGNLLLLVQEGITNAIKHAQPTQIRLELEFAPKAVSIAIVDDGQGFDVDQAAGPKEGHFGLQGMRERIKRLGGHLRVESRRGHGTRVRAVVPE